MTILRVLFAIVAALDLELDQTDVHTGFLHGDIDEELYMKQPQLSLAPSLLVIQILQLNQEIHKWAPD